jgi:NAD(P)-dependent dehydrogenase (short-subunit alcohol dehydrogenase family)
MSGIDAVVVSGAARGVGRATAELMADAGLFVYAGVLSSKDAVEWRDARVERGNLIPIALDITRSGDIEGLLAALDADPRGIRLVALVNVAGIAQFDVVEHIDPAVMRRMFEVNVFGALALTQALLPRLKASRGRLVFVTSMAARVAAPLMGVYSATKAAIESLIDALRVEVRPWGVSVAIVEPGGIRTAMTDEALVHLRDAVRRSTSEGVGSAPYAAAYQSIADAIVAGQAGYLPTGTVAKTLLELVRAPRVPTRNLLGRDAKIVVLLRRILSDRLLDSLFARQFKLRLPPSEISK